MLPKSTIKALLSLGKTINTSSDTVPIRTVSQPVILSFPICQHTAAITATDATFTALRKEVNSLLLFTL